MTMITLQDLIALLPLLLVGLTVVVVMLCIAWHRQHLVSAMVSIVGLTSALISLIWVWREAPTTVTDLMQVDHFAVLYSVLILLASIACCIFAYAWLLTFPDNKEEFYLLVLLSTLGALLLAYANHLASLFIGIELLSLPLFGMIGYAYRQSRSLEASIKYTILSAAASAFLLFGMALLYAESGSLSFGGLGADLAITGLHRPVLLAGLGMMLVGFCFKLSLFPFQLWTPDVYQGAPAPATAFLATASKVAVFAVLTRFFLYAPLANSDSIRMVLGIIAACSIIFGNLLALWQNNIKRLLGYSSIAHLGYLLVALIAVQARELPITAVGVYLVGYLFNSLGAFGVVSLMSSPYKGGDTDSLFSYRGLFWHKPVLSAVMTTILLSLAGIPMTIGFIGKFYILAVGVSAKLWWLTAAVIIGSAIGIYYYLRTVVSLYLHAPHKLQRDTPRYWMVTGGGIVVLTSAVLVILLGVYPQPLIDIVKDSMPTLFSIRSAVPLI